MPNFFIAGAPKAGTDLLYYQLDQHPQIYMSPVKEPNFFAAEVRPENFSASLRQHVQGSAENMRKYLDSEPLTKRFGGIVTSRADYEKLFAAAQSQPAIGEGSVSYLWSKTAAAEIAVAVPRAKIIIVLMDPAERAFHQYLKSLSDGNVTHSFSTHLDLAFADRALPGTEIRLFNPFLGFGEYFAQVQRFLSHFAPEQLSISLYEEVLADYGPWFSRILGFLGVDSHFVPADVDVPSTPHFEHGAEPQMLPSERARLVDFYRPDILALQDIIHRDLRKWMQ